MALLLLILFVSTIIFLFYYEILWKKFERERGKSLLGMVGDFAFKDEPVIVPVVAKSTDEKEKNPWDDWKYRLMVELHRKGQIRLEEGAAVAGVSAKEVEDYFDILEEKGKVQSAGDAERGIFYRIVSEA